MASRRPLSHASTAGSLALGLLLAVPGLTLAADDPPVHFNHDVRPLLSKHCFQCHGPSERDRQAGLRLDRADGAEGAYRARDGVRAIVPGAPEDSELWRRVTSNDPDVAMPPAGAHAEPLDADGLAVLGRWIADGAQYEDYWSFVAPSAPALPEVRDAEWCRRPLDRFVLARLEEAGLRPSPEADRRTLVRRLHLDLTGLPPTRDEVHAFLADEAPDAYERLVDRLLASPAYGEHMARYWLDLVRFADTNGVHHDHYRETSAYRDWVIRAFDANLPYDRFVADQLAGDLMPEPTDDQLVASGFLRLHMIIDKGTRLPEESFARNVIDRTTAFGTAFLGLTLQCAVCHDHKYDPFTQRDFYQLTAFFNNLDADPETLSAGSDRARGLQPPYIEFPSNEQRAALAALDARIAPARASLDEQRAAAGESPDEAARAALDLATRALDELHAERDRVLFDVPAAMVMRERSEVRPAYVLLRGDYQRPGAEVARDTPAFLPPLEHAGEVPTRLELARWLAAPENPLFARVFVNRQWQQLFGVGLVKTSEDLGTQGEWPSDVDLLDHLAVAFRTSGWDVRALVRDIVLSATYRQSSSAPPQAYARDPENRLLARGARFRLDAEVIRDQILATSGLLSPLRFGKSVKPPQPAGLWEAVVLPSSYPRTYEPDSGEATRRRSVYSFWKRAMPPPQMSILNAPTRESCTARRERTNTPLQSLLLLNEEEYLKAARHLAATVLASAGGEPDARLDALFETVTARLPEDDERAILLSTVADLQALYAERAELAERLCEGEPQNPACSAAELAAWTVLASTVYNLDAVRTRE